MVKRDFIDDEPEIGEFGGLPVLCCPNCGHDYTHICRTVVHKNIPGDDNLSVEVSPRGPHGFDVGEVDVENPSQRRSAVSIVVECEACMKESALRLIQHKGNNHIGTQVLD